MARLHKKKPTGEKKIRKEKQDSAKSIEEKNKSSVTASPLKAKSEKKQTEVVVSDPNFIQRGIDFFREVKVELKKVTWPSQKQTTGTTLVVIIFVFVVAAFLGLFDFSLSKLVQVVLT